ncbi:hypothetical protein ACJJTC_005533 [Scirpophaga incertulas]
MFRERRGGAMPLSVSSNAVIITLFKRFSGGGFFGAPARAGSLLPLGTWELTQNYSVPGQSYSGSCTTMDGAHHHNFGMDVVGYIVAEGADLSNNSTILFDELWPYDPEYAGRETYYTWAPGVLTFCNNYNTVYPVPLNTASGPLPVVESEKPYY